MEVQLAILLRVLKFCFSIFIWIIPAMLIINILLELGMLKKFTVPLGRFFTRFASLPPEVAAAFVSSFGSSYAGGSMLVNLREKNLLNKQQVFLGALTLSIPFHVREIFTFYIPLIFPLLGAILGTIYLTVHTLAIAAKAIFVILMGKFALQDDLVLKEIVSNEERTEKKNLVVALRSSLYSCLRPLKRMLITIPLTALVIYELGGLGIFNAIPVNVESLGLPSCSTVCLVSYMTNTIAGLSALAACYQGGEMSLIQAVKTMLWGSLFAGPVFLIRFSGTYYLGVYGPVLGMKIALTSFAINSTVYVICLVIASQFG